MNKIIRNTIILTVITVISGFLLGLVYEVTAEPIARTQAVSYTHLLIFCVSVFILCGFEHCIANMFYFSLAGVWSAKTFGYLLVMTLGNSLGGMLIPALKRVQP